MNTYWTNLTRKLTGMMREQTISPGGTPTNGQKRNLSKKPPSGYSGRAPKRLSGRLRYRSALDSRFSFDCGAACACLGERSEPTCIRQAHATVPRGEFFLQIEVEKSSKNKLLTIRGLDVILYTESGFNQA